MNWYFDFISPYAYLQSTRLHQLNQLRPISCTPVLFAGLLNHWENIGPAELPPKRKWTFREVSWIAQSEGIDLTFPQHHPFNPLPLLRLSIVHGNSLEVVQRLFRFVWAEGCLPQDPLAFSTLLDELGTTPAELQSATVKAQLLNNGDEAIKSSVFGVPTLVIDHELFWGHNATDMAIAYISNNDTYPREKITAADNLPQGAGRPGHKTANNPPQILTATPPEAKQSVDTITANRPRIPLLPIDLAEPADLVHAIRKRRGGQLIELDRLLLYSQPLSEGWNHFLGNIREHFSVPQQLRELSMCTVAVLNNAEYEFSQHAPLYIKFGGSELKTALLRKPDSAKLNPAFTEAEQLTISLTIQLTKDVRIDDELFSQSVNLFGNEHLVELIATIAAYNMVSRFLVAFELHP